MTNPTSLLARSCIAILLLMLTGVSAFAGPGAHGPNGEHLDQNAAAGAPSAQPRVEAATEIFELVAVLSGGELSLLIDRFDSNAPVLGAKVEVEAAGRKAEAKFHADHGDYAIDDPALIAALAAPGQHAVVISVVAGEDSDLLNGTLVVTAPGARSTASGHTHDGDEHDHALEYAAWVSAGIVALGAAMFFLRRRRHRRTTANVMEVTR